MVRSRWVLLLGSRPRLTTRISCLRPATCPEQRKTAPRRNCGSAVALGTGYREPVSGSNRCPQHPSTAPVNSTHRPQPHPSPCTVLRPAVSGQVGIAHQRTSAASMREAWWTRVVEGGSAAGGARPRSRTHHGRRRRALTCQGRRRRTGTCSVRRRALTRHRRHLRRSSTCCVGQRAFACQVRRWAFACHVGRWAFAGQVRGSTLAQRTRSLCGAALARAALVDLRTPGRGPGDRRQAGALVLPAAAPIGGLAGTPASRLLGAVVVFAQRRELIDVGATWELSGPGGVPRPRVVGLAPASRHDTARVGTGVVQRQRRVDQPVRGDPAPTPDADHPAAVVEDDRTQIRAALVDQPPGGGGIEPELAARQPRQQLRGHRVAVEEAVELHPQQQLWP